MSLDARTYVASNMGHRVGGLSHPQPLPFQNKQTPCDHAMLTNVNPTEEKSFASSSTAIAVAAKHEIVAHQAQNQLALETPIPDTPE